MTQAQLPRVSGLSAAEFAETLGQFSNAMPANRDVLSNPGQWFSARMNELLPELKRRLDDPQLSQQLAQNAGQIYTYLESIEAQMPNYLSEADAVAFLPDLVGLRTSIYLMQSVPEREFMESLAATGYVSRPGVEPVPQPQVRTVLSSNDLDLSGMQLPRQWGTHFPAETQRDDTSQAISDGYAYEISRDFDAARQSGMRAVSNIASAVQDYLRTISGHGGDTFTIDDLVDSARWSADAQEFLMDMLGKSDWTPDQRAAYAPQIANLLSLISEGRFAEAFDQAASDTTLGQALTTILAETLEQRMTMHVPVGYLNVGIEGTIFNVQFAGDEEFRMFARAFFRTVLNQNYSPAVRVTDLEGRTILDVTMEPTSDFLASFGGGGAVGISSTLGNPLRTLSLEVGAQYDPITEQPIFTGRLQFEDRSGEWKAPIDGVLYPSAYVEGSVDVAGSTGTVGVGGLLEAGSSYFVFGDLSLFALISVDYMRRFGQAVAQPTETLELGAGGRMVYSDIFSIDGRFVYNPLDQTIGGIGNAMINIGAGVYLGFSGGYREVDINVIGRTQRIGVPEVGITTGLNIDELIKYIRGE